MKVSAALLTGLSVALCAALCPAASRAKDPADSSATLLIVRPPSLAGKPAGGVTTNGRAVKKSGARRALSIAIEPGVYDCYGATAAKPAASVTVAAGARLFVTAQDDAQAQAALPALRKGQDERAAIQPVKKPGRSAAKRSGRIDMASIVLVGPSHIFGGPVGRIVVDGKRATVTTGTEMVEIAVRPCRIAVHGPASAKPLAGVTVDSGALVYVVNRSSARSLRQLGDLFLEGANRKGARALYRQALAADPGMTDLCRTYAELALEAGDRAGAIDALRKVVAAGKADGPIYQDLGDLLAATNANDEARRMYDQALKIAGDDPAVLESLAKVKIKTGDLKGAAQAYEQAIRLRPDTLRLHKAAGDLYLKQRDTVKAVAAYRVFLDKGGANNAAALLVGGYEHRRRNSEDAVRYLTRVTGKDAQKVNTLRMLGESHFRLGNFKKAVVPLKTAANRYPRSPQWPAVVALLVQAHMELKEYKKAAVWIDAYAKAGMRQSPDVAYYRAYLKEQASPAAARALYERNVKSFPRDYRNYLRCGVLLAAEKKTLPRSLDMLKKAVSLADTVPDAWLSISRVYRKLGRGEEELQALQVFAVTHPQHTEANARIGELMMDKGQVGEAMERLESVEQDSGGDPAVLKALAQGYAQTGKNDEAVKTLQRAKKTAPADTSVRLRLVALYQAMGRNEMVLEEYRELTRLQRDNGTLLAYAQLLFDNNRFDSAATVIEDIRATQPDNVEALMLLGMVLRAQEKYAEAIKVYEEIAYIDPGYYPALYQRAETHLENGQPHWAEAFFRRALQRNPKFAPAELGLAKVAKMRRNRPLYKQHLAKAYAMAPSDPAVLQEREESQRVSW